jgi:two-component sensor histidine kinase
MKREDISVSINRQDLTLATPYADNSADIPADFNGCIPTSPGLRLVIGLVNQLQGTINLDRTTGTTFNIIVKEKE